MSDDERNTGRDERSGDSVSDLPVISLKGVTKVFDTEDGSKEVLHGVDLDVRPGEIFGLIGLSGAGKSTLVRLINGIEKPTKGTVMVLGEDISSLKGSGLRSLRTQIGMIFQQFNLMPSRTALDNVLLPLRGSGLSKEERHDRARHLLDVVGLAEKADEYPSELSGGQQQRVAIARSLVGNPKVLLCDEATSALDPTVTRSILELLERINHELGVTIVLVTHQMSVVKDVCDRVAVIDKGSIVESGSVFSVFCDPQADLTKSFVNTTSNLGKIETLEQGNAPVLSLGTGQHLVRMRYRSRDVSEPLVSRITTRFGVEVNIFLADVEIVQDAPIGGIVGVFSGSSEKVDAAVEYLRGKNINVEVLDNE